MNEMGNLPLTRDHVRDVWIAPWLQSMVQDIRFAGRRLAKERAFTLAVVALSVHRDRIVSGMSRYGGDPKVIGRASRLNDRPSVLIGVMPAGFEFPHSGLEESVEHPAVHRPGIARGLVILAGDPVVVHSRHAAS